MIHDRSKLTTEKLNPRSRDLDRRSTLAIIDLINAEDRRVPAAVARERKRIAEAVEIIVARLRRGGRLFYVGAGTSGRLGVLDAAECPPTFGTEPWMVQGIIAGGRRALARTAEGAEDSATDGAAALEHCRVTPYDVVVGIAACGLTPFVRGALRYARRLGAATIFITCAPEVRGKGSKYLLCAAPKGPTGKRYLDPFPRADVVICPVVGPEVVTGSTRMKAGTATKLVLNTLTTTAMVRLGKVYGNLMVDLRATSAKLRERAERIVMSVTGLTRPRARALLKRARGQTKVAIVMHHRRLDFAAARDRLKACDGSLRKAMEP